MVTNDIAILKLAQPVELDTNVQVACLPDPNTKMYPKESNIEAYAVGWGTTEEGGFLPEYLQNVVLRIYNGSTCENASAQINPNWDTQICAGEYKGGKDTCQGWLYE